MSLDLIERLQKATGPDRGLDYDIAMYLDGPFGAWDSFRKYDAAFPTYTRRDAPAYTSSIDAALTLVPEGKDWRVDTMTGLPGAIVCAPNAWLSQRTAPRLEHGATPAIALCIAALKAALGCRGKLA